MRHHFREWTLKGHAASSLPTGNALSWNPEPLGEKSGYSEEAAELAVPPAGLQSTVPEAAGLRKEIVWDAESLAPAVGSLAAAEVPDTLEQMRAAGPCAQAPDPDSP